MAAPKSSRADRSKPNTRVNQERPVNSKKGKGKEKSAKPPSKHTLIPSANWNEQEIPWEWTVITSSAASRVSPIFTKDGGYVCLVSKISLFLMSPSHFFSLVGSSVKIHSTATGQIVSTLKPPNSSSTSNDQLKVFSCAVINPHNPFQLITGSLDGSLMVWDFLDGSLLRTIDISQPVYYLCAHEQFKDYVFVVVSRSEKGVSPDSCYPFIRIYFSSRSECCRDACVFAEQCFCQLYVPAISR